MACASGALDLCRRPKPGYGWFAGVALVGFSLAGCGREEEIHTAEFLAMGTTVTIDVAEPAPSDLDGLLAEIGSLLQRLGREWYPWTPDGSGELARLNRAIASGESAEVSVELAALLHEARALAALTGGRFDPTIGSLVELWGFTSATREAGAPLPTPDAVETWTRHRPTYADLILNGTTVGSRNPAVKLDLGAVGKGRAVDLAVSTLKARGVANALVTAGGNVRAVGAAPQRPWRVALRDARGPGILGWIELRDGESIDTSGDYERVANVQGKRIHHVFDPHAGTPVNHTASVTVIASTGMLADAAATALLVAGPGHWQELARELGIEAVLRMDADGHVQATAAMASRLQPLADVDSRYRIEVVGNL